MKYPSVFLLAILVWTACSPSVQPEVALVPQPAQLQVKGGFFALSPATQLLRSDGGRFDAEAAFLQSTLVEMLGEEITAQAGGNVLELVYSQDLTQAESYQLEVGRDRVSLIAGDAAGMFYAMETLRQLMPADLEGEGTAPEILIPELSISDAPSIAWRGMHLDVSRHFFSMDYLHRYVDLLALYKMNKLHLHLTDDQGWRLEIKKYPRLTEESAWRTFNNQDSVCIEKAKEDPRFQLDPKHLRERDGVTEYGGFYTQEEMRELVRYAQSRHIEIIPEIDMPGHMMAAIQVYPELACTGSAGWGKVFSTPLCPGNEQVYEFVEGVLTEVMDIFPSKYIHIGADEVEKSSWEESKACQALMAAEGMSSVEELQSYFVNRVTGFIKSKGKEVIVWDDAIHPGVDSTLYVMYWRNWAGGVQNRVANNGNPMIYTPGNPMYFSRLDAQMYPIYHFEFFGSKYPEDKKHLAYGLQACVWTETVPSEDLADAIIFPKLLALSERAWSPREVHDWDGFKERLQSQLKRLDQLGVKYTYEVTKELTPFLKVDTVKQEIGVILESELVKPTIYYTTDGTEPTTASERYEGEFHVSGSVTVKAAIFENGQIQEPVLSRKVDYHQAIGKKVTYHKPWNTAYPAGDAGSFTDGLRGGNANGDGKWQGFTNDIDVTVDMGKVQELHTFSASFLQNIGPGIYMPDSVIVSVSVDGKDFEQVLQVANEVPKDQKGLVFADFAGSMGNVQARYIHVRAVNGNRAFIFSDELVIN
ncbi:family 20 glycosylhydrolase [Algoriphagus sp. H41]|uniref:beta-N-acetylhexosaminidase n=1 Tax=Algoriphagus oliviformis TaxID=2811231 RepID=A0ABS3C5M9_9BACT|nr:family 20 glycosylhydrolase [Algoriphagus oliviformis]MBN7812422.1 family 20 glycosylhydrolase [Algoriphagus oliviformis]